jgi:GntR family transcriptional repressor for pyruvate dehydrogenase complex
MAVTDKAVSTIRAMIISGELRPGQRLPPEKELSERLGLSRNSLREAVKSLEIIRVLDVRRGDGTYVTSLEPQLLLEAMAFVADLHQDASVIEILAVRRVLEPHAAGLAAQLITEEQLEELRRSLHQAEATTSVPQLVEHDLEFHRVITGAGGNAYLASLLDGMSSETVRARVWRGITEEGAATRTLEEHRAILRALENRDSDRAREALEAHIVGIESWIRSALPS